MQDPTVTQLRNAVAVLTRGLELIRAGRAIALSVEITDHLYFARQLLEQTAPGAAPRLAVVPGGAA